MKIRLLLFLSFLFGALSLMETSAQNKEFWFVAPDAAKAHSDRPVFFMITAGARESEVTISMPANDSFLPKTRALAPYESWKVDFSSDEEMDLIENSINDSYKVTEKGILITATNAVSAYYEINGGSQKEIFTLKGEKALGSEFYTPFQTAYDISTKASFKNQAFRQIQIVATEDNTVVHFQAPSDIANSNGVTLAANTQHSITLQRGETLLLRGADRTSDLMGTHVWTENGKKIAVIVFEDSVASGNGEDPIGDQLVPVDMLGTSYLVIKGYSTNTVQDHIYVLATKDNTDVKVGGILKATINAGQFEVIPVGVGAGDPQYRYVETSKPAYCYHQSAHGGELGGALIPSMYSISSRSISFANHNNASNNIFLIYRDKAKDSFTVKDGSGTKKLDVKNTDTGVDGWLYSKQAFPKSDETVTISNKDGAFALGYFTAVTSSTALYGYLSNFGGFSFDEDTIYHCGDSYIFDGGYAKSYEWKGPGGITGDKATFEVTKSGVYSATVYQDPFVMKDTVYLKLQNFKGDYKLPSRVFINEEHDFSIKINTADWHNVYDVKYDWQFFDGDDINGIPMKEESMGGPGFKSGNEVKVPKIKWTSSGRKKVVITINNLDAGCEEKIVHDVIVYDYFDNITDADCFLRPTGNDFTIREHLAFDNVHSMATPLVANLTGDGPEIIVPGVQSATNRWTSNSLVIIEPKTGLQKRIINTVPFALHGQSIAIADVDGNGTCSIFIQSAQDGKIYCYAPTGGYKSGFSTTGALDAHYIPQLADLNNDGIPELVAGPYIFNARTGQQLLKMTLEADGTGYGNPQGVGAALTNPSYNYAGYYFMPAIGDVDNDGYLEIVAGSTIYKPVKGTTTWSYTTTKVDAGVSPPYLDGPTILVDFDLDGNLDVCVVGMEKTKQAGTSKYQLYVWNPLTGAIIAQSPQYSASKVSIPFAGDFDKNTYPNIAFATLEGMMSFQYAPSATNKMEAKGPESKFKGTAGFTMFDFNQDRNTEIVYRGTDKLTVASYQSGNWQTAGEIPALSGTLAEYPVVADVDQDGRAEIIVTRADQAWSSEGDNITGKLSIYKSEDATHPWAPARSVWNQWNYNGVNVNADMTIPKFPISPATMLGATRPYNGMLQQQTMLDNQGEAVFLTPNPQIVSPGDITYSYDIGMDVLTINNLKIKNEGDSPLNPPFYITVYKNTLGAADKCVSAYLGGSIAVGETRAISVEVSNFSNLLPVTTLVLRINDKGDGKNDQLSCKDPELSNSNSFANIPFDALAWADSYRKCIGDNVSFSAKDLPGASVTYEWLKDITPLTTTKDHNISNLQLTDAGEYTFKADKINGNLSVTLKLPYLSVAPATLYWRPDAEDHNWNNSNNWATDISGTNKIKAVPSTCTHVHIPGKSDHFPSLAIDTTDRSIYGEPTVDKISFHYRSELAYPHLLKYNQAYAQYNFAYYNGGNTPGNNADNAGDPVLSRDTWYALSAPLKNMASGDFSFAGYPFSWQAGHQDASLGEDGMLALNMTTMPANDVNLSDNYHSIALKVAGRDNSKIGFKDHKNLEGVKGIVSLPYFEDLNAYRSSQSYDPIAGVSTFYYFDQKTLEPVHSPVGRMKRGREAYRFVFEDPSTEQAPTIDGGVKGYTIQVKAPGASKKVLIGNPFIASINTHKFLNANNGIDGTQPYYVYDSSDQTWKSQSYNATNNINSFQAFIVTLKADASTAIHFPLEGDNALTGTGQASNMPMIAPLALSISTNDQNGRGGEPALLVAAMESESVDVDKLLSLDEGSAPEVFLVNPKAAHGNLHYVYREGMAGIGLGIKAAAGTDELSLRFDNVSEFAASQGVQAQLADLYTGRVYDLNQATEIVLSDLSSAPTAQQQAGGNLVDTDRFYLRFGTEDGGTSDILHVRYDDDKNLRIGSINNLEQVRIYTLSGQLIFDSGRLGHTNNYVKNIPLKAGAYIIQAETNQIEKKEKIVVQ